MLSVLLYIGPVLSMLLYIGLVLSVLQYIGLVTNLSWQRSWTNFQLYSKFSLNITVALDFNVHCDIADDLYAARLDPGRTGRFRSSAAYR